MKALNNPYNFWTLLILANIAMYSLTIAISYSWSKVKGHPMLKLTTKDVSTSIIILVINVLVALPGYFLFKQGYITFKLKESLVIDFFLLYFLFDIGMYLFHLVSHYVWPFKMFHSKHHAHHHFNAISLYVMEPVESILFAVLLTICSFIVPLNLYSFLAFIVLNWALGVLGHLNTNSTKQPLIFGNHVFHKMHHQHGNTNFGFYTVIWDRLFNTLYKDTE